MKQIASCKNADTVYPDNSGVHAIPVFEIKRKNFNIAGTYPKDPDCRRVSSLYADHSTYGCVDAAIREPVRILNEEFGLNTLWSCEGHEPEWKANGGILGFMYDEKGNVVGRCSQESYIALSEMYIENVDKFVLYLRSIGFGEGSTLRPLCKGKYYSVYLNFPNGHLESDIKYGPECETATVFLRVGPHNVNMDNAGWNEHNGTRFKNLCEAVSGNPAFSQEEWDSIRDAGWEIWLNIISNFT
ncbi:hypothetical protein CUJ83_14930 [Methanocella sp. CWC-04]|uniref:Uncharacterized protein n=1 Tax=Methanooceanicella nereidis TaxID=2052831 RepID=A0AAP2W638_9EURY|nr:hypothetical protein [Methanocella sp. CWC-04]MCD1296295.1 hypothetical protein [Methanocella sp. CWC-04]